MEIYLNLGRNKWVKIETDDPAIKITVGGYIRASDPQEVVPGRIERRDYLSTPSPK